ncbi:hypothetical protein HanIR_Chr01g0036331 [Helianthus annuus]|nr:hypothetical protein HanIR_Chr01g0036331 [Helianthus annuus]
MVGQLKSSCVEHLEEGVKNCFSAVFGFGNCDGGYGSCSCNDSAVFVRMIEGCLVLGDSGYIQGGCSAETKVEDGG